MSTKFGTHSFGVGTVLKQGRLPESLIKLFVVLLLENIPSMSAMFFISIFNL